MPQCRFVAVDGGGHTMHEDSHVVQIADQQVNTIDCSVAEGDPVQLGERIGMIRRGSQVDLFVPRLRPGDFPGLAVGTKVRAGSTVLLS